MKTKVILHGGFTRVQNDLNTTFFKEMLADTPDDITILLVYFASEKFDNTDKMHWATAGFVKNACKKQLIFVEATKEHFLEQVEMADIVYIHGGNTDKLLETLQKYPSFTTLLAGKTVAGSSAGAYALAAFGSTSDRGEVREGFGVVPIRVVCHFESETLPPNPESVEKLKNTAPELDLILLKDYESKVFWM